MYLRNNRSEKLLTYFCLDTKVTKDQGEVLKPGSLNCR